MSVKVKYFLHVLAKGSSINYVKFHNSVYEEKLNKSESESGVIVHRISYKKSTDIYRLFSHWCFHFYSFVSEQTLIKFQIICGRSLNFLIPPRHRKSPATISLFLQPNVRGYSKLTLKLVYGNKLLIWKLETRNIFMGFSFTWA